MKKIFNFIMIVAIMATSCAKELEPETGGTTSNVEYKVFGAVLDAEEDEDSTKTTINFSSTPKQLLWSEGDAIGVVGDPVPSTSPYKTYNKFALQGGKGTTSGSFAGSIVTTEGDYYYAVYPYYDGGNANTQSTAVLMNTSIPTTQRVGPEEICEASVVTAGRINASETQFPMAVVSSFYKLKLVDSKVKSAKIFGMGKRQTSGIIRVVIDSKPRFSTSNNASGSSFVELLPKEGGNFSDGTYYATGRWADSLVLKLENEEGKVFYRSTSKINKGNDWPNKTFDWGTFHDADIAWRDKAELNLVFSNGSKLVQPFTTDLPTSGGIDGDYSLSSGETFHIYANQTALTKSGLQMRTGGDYILLPAKAGMRLKEVIVSAGSTLYCNVQTTAGVVVSHPSHEFGTGSTWDFILPRSSVDTQYKLYITTGTSKSSHLKSLTLIYSGEATAPAVNEAILETAEMVYDNGDIKLSGNGRLAGSNLGNVSWTIEATATEGDWSSPLTLASGKGSVIAFNSVLNPTADRYYLRIKAGSITSEVKSVAVFNGTLIYDFSGGKEAVKSRISINKTEPSKTDSLKELERPLTRVPVGTSEDSLRIFAGKDYYWYKGDFVMPLVITAKFYTNTSKTRGLSSYSLYYGDESDDHGLRAGIKCSKTTLSSDPSVTIMVPKFNGWTFTGFSGVSNSEKSTMMLYSAISFYSSTTVTVKEKTRTTNPHTLIQTYEGLSVKDYYAMINNGVEWKKVTLTYTKN